MPTALVTGGSGFIGGLLASKLRDSGYDVTIADGRPLGGADFRYVRCDVRDISQVMEAAKGQETIYHLAGVLGTDYLLEGNLGRVEDCLDVNVKGALHIYEAARMQGSRVVTAGLVPSWANPYMITKKAATQFGQMYFHEYGTDIRTLEFTHVYGPGQKERPVRKAIPNFIVSALKGEPVVVFGAGDKYMDCIYVDDAVEALRIAGEHDQMKGMVAQMGTGQGITVLDLAHKIIEMTSSQSSVVFEPMRPGEPRDRQGFVAANLFVWNQYTPWTPTTTLEDGLQKTIAWHRQRLDAE